MKFDYTNTEDGNTQNPVIPAGTYKVEVIDVEEMINQNSGNEFWIIKLKVIEGEYIGSRIDDFNIFSPSLDSANKAMFLSFGFPVDKQIINIEPAELIGKKMMVTINQEEYKGKLQNKVERFGGYQPIKENQDNINNTEKLQKEYSENNSDIPF